MKTFISLACRMTGGSMGGWGGVGLGWVSDAGIHGCRYTKVPITFARL